MAAGAERSKLEPVPDVGRDVSHDQRAEAGSLAIRRRGDGLDVAGPERAPVDVELALDDGGVGDDLAVELEHEMDAADGMVPVVVGEPLVVVRPECGHEQLADGRNTRLRQVVSRQPAQSQSIGFDAGARAHPRGGKPPVISKPPASGTGCVPADLVTA